MPDKRVTVWVCHFKDRASLMLHNGLTQTRGEPRASLLRLPTKRRQSKRGRTWSSGRDGNTRPPCSRPRKNRHPQRELLACYAN